MVQFPPEYVQLTRFPGYYWNTETKKLYSIKISGNLRPLVFSKGYRGFTRQGGFVNIPAGYKISCAGVRRYLDLATIDKLVATADKLQTVPVAHNHSKVIHND